MQHICVLCIPRTVQTARTLLGSTQWHHNERDGVTNNRRLDQDCLLNRLLRRQPKKTSVSSSASLASVRESTGNRGSPLTKGQWRGACFHLITSSYSCLWVPIEFNHILLDNLAGNGESCCTLNSTAKILNDMGKRWYRSTKTLNSSRPSDAYLRQ